MNAPVTDTSHASGDAAKPDAAAVRSAMARILDSGAFAGSGRARELLVYVVAEALAGRGAQIGPGTIARDVFGRNEALDAAADPLVRVQTGRTRVLLERYYETEGRSDPVRIAVPKGSYAPTFLAGGGWTEPRPASAFEGPKAQLDHSLRKRLSSVAGSLRGAAPLAVGGLAASLAVVGLGALLSPSPGAEPAPYPIVAVLPFEDLTEGGAGAEPLGGASSRAGPSAGEGSDLSTGFQRAVARDLQRLRTVRVALAQGGAPSPAAYEVTGTVLAVDGAVDFVLRLQTPEGEAPLLSERLRGDDADGYREALRDLSARATGRAAPSPGRALDVPGAEGAEAFRCYAGFERLAATEAPEGLAESYACLEEAVRRRPGDGRLLGALAWAIALGAPETGRMDAGLPAPEMSLQRALATAEQAVAVDPECDEAHAHLGAIRWRMGHEEAALASLRQAAALNPGDPEHASRLAHLLAFTGSWNEAERQVRRAIERSGDPPGRYVMPLYYRALVEGRGRAALDHLAAQEGSGDPHLPVYALAAAVAAGDQARILTLRPEVEVLATARGGDPLRGAREWIRSDEIVSVLEARLREVGIVVLRG